MNYNEIADRIVAEVSSYILRDGDERSGPYYINWNEPITADKAVHDWRVAGALMEKVITSDAPYTMSVAMQPSRRFIAWFRGEGIGEQDSLPLAIVLATLKALEDAK